MIASWCRISKTNRHGIVGLLLVLAWSGIDTAWAVQHSSYGAAGSLRFRVVDPLPTQILDLPNQPVLGVEASVTHSPSGRSALAVDSARLHPAIGDNGAGRLLLSYERSKPGDSLLLWFGSSNDGATWGSAIYVPLAGRSSYPSAEFWGSGTQFYGTFVPPKGNAHSYLLDIPDPGNMGASSVRSWDFSGLAAEIVGSDLGCYSGLESWRYGALALSVRLKSMFGGNTIPVVQLAKTQDSVHLLYLSSVPSCGAPTATVDRGTGVFYALWEARDSVTDQWYILVTHGAINGDTLYAKPFLLVDNLLRLRHPSVAAHNDNVVSAIELYAEEGAPPYNSDILCIATATGNIDEPEIKSFITGSVGAEHSPRVSHIGGRSFMCTFVRSDTAFYSVTENVGQTWSAPLPVNAGNPVVGEYHFCDAGETSTNGGTAGKQVVYETRLSNGSIAVAKERIAVSVDSLIPDFAASPRWGKAPLSVTFTDKTFSINPIVSRNWDFGDNQTGSGAAVTHVYSAAGTYDVTLIAGDGLKSDTLLKQHFIVASDTIVTFAQSSPFMAAPMAIAVTDFDRDNNADLVYANNLQDSAILEWQWNLDVAFGIGDGTFTPPQTIALDRNVSDFALAYINADTLIDIVCASTDQLVVALNSGNRTFSVSSIARAGTAIDNIAVGYFNRDRYPDAAVTPNSIYFGTGSGFGSSTTVPMSFQSVDVSDMNEDGYDDLVIGATNDTGYIYVSNGIGGFTRSHSFFIGNRSTAVTTGNALADFNRDGHRDFAVLTPHFDQANQSMLFIGFGNGAGALTALDTIRIYGDANNVVTADVDRDRNLDLAVANASEGVLEVYFGDSLGHFPRYEGVDLNTSDQTRVVASGDFNRDANPDFVIGTPFSGPPSLKNLIVLTNEFPAVQVRDEELFVTGYSASTGSPSPVSVVSLEVLNPSRYAVSEDFRTVAGSDYWRYDIDNNQRVDERAADYNLQFGEYVVIIRPGMGANPGDAFTMDIRVDGTQQIRPFLSYSSAFTGLKREPMKANQDSIVFYYTVDSVVRIQPPNGEVQNSTRPTFIWSNLFPRLPAAVSYNFQLDRYFDFRSPMYNLNNLSTPSFVPSVSLGRDSVFYWRVRSSVDGGVNWTDFSRTFAAYIGADAACCFGTSGNVNGSGGVDLADLSALVSYLTGGGYILTCHEEANVNGSGSVDLADLSALVAYLTGGGYVLPVCP